MNENLIQVLWVEDDPIITKTFPMEAAAVNLELVPFGCWKDAEEALTTDFSRWSAIILDARCKYKKGDQDNATRFLTNVLSKIGVICTQHHRIIPWYILSGGSDEELNDLIIEDREKWDGDWPKKFYSKTTDRDMLFHRIRYHAKLSPERQTRMLLYPDVFRAIEIADLDPEVDAMMEDLLVPIHQADKTAEDYNNKMTLIRKCIEHIFRSMAKHGILPNQKQGDSYVLHKVLTDSRGAITNTWCSLILSGRDAKDRNGKTVVKSMEKVLPNAIKDSFHNLIEIAAAYEHAVNKDANEEQQKNSRQTAEFLDYIGHAPYLLRSMTMELCCVILWYAHYLADHEDEERNALNWEVL